MKRNISLGHWIHVIIVAVLFIIINTCFSVIPKWGLVTFDTFIVSLLLYCIWSYEEKSPWNKR